ncbi:MAG: hypothetical protein LBF61_04280 [Azoarcus sp.]|nr:hypothetical protein [Azoarcus sp.]
MIKRHCGWQEGEAGLRGGGAAAVKSSVVQGGHFGSHDLGGLNCFMYTAKRCQYNSPLPRRGSPEALKLRFVPNNTFQVSGKFFPAQGGVPGRQAIEQYGIQSCIL